MIKELSELGKMLREQKSDNEWVHNALKKEPISIELIIDRDGSFQEFRPVDKKLTDAEAITAKRGKRDYCLIKQRKCFVMVVKNLRRSTNYLWRNWLNTRNCLSCYQL